MKTKDGRFIEKRIKGETKFIRRILYKIKESNKFSWSTLATKLNISEYSIVQGWLRRRNTLPLSVFKKLIKLHPSLKFNDVKNRIEIIEPFWGQKIGKKSEIENKIKIPKIHSIEFAEFYGILLGDGCIYSNLSGFCISSNTLADKDYIERYVPDLIIKLFGIKPKIYYSKKTKSANCVLYSKKITTFLISLGFPKGKKGYGNPKILDIFFHKEEEVCACLRGINDTDGSICGHPHSKIMLNISITSKSLLKSCVKAFETLKIKSGPYNKGINLYGKEKLRIYFKCAGSSNLKHIHKYQEFVRKGKVPNTKQTEAFLKSNKILRIELPYYGPVV